MNPGPPAWQAGVLVQARRPPQPKREPIPRSLLSLSHLRLNVLFYEVKYSLNFK